MAPVSTDQESSSYASVAETCFSTCTVQVVLGCVLPLVAVASVIPIIMVRRHFTTKHVFTSQQPKVQTRTTTPRAQTTPRLPLTSVYIARVDYYLPPSNIVASHSVAESRLDDSKDSLAQSEDQNIDNGDNDLPAPSPGFLPLASPMVSLPSLSSMLCEFTAYADAIEPEYLTETRRSSTCLLDSAFSSMEVKTLSLTELATIPSASPVVNATAVTLPEVSLRSYKTTSCGELRVEHENERAHGVIGPSAKESPLFYGEERMISAKQDFPREPIATPSLNAVHPMIENSYEDDVEEISTSHLVPATTSWSIILDSSSTLASFLAVRLSQFPSVPVLPPFPPVSFAAASIIARHSESSLDSTFTCSVSAPASLNILDIKLGDTLPLKRSNGQHLINWPSSSNPGELWDEEDDLRFSVCRLQKPVDLFKSIRHTWTAGIANSRSDKGELWDDEDDRRFSHAGEITMVEAFVSSSILSMEMPDDSMSKPSLNTSDSGSLADQLCDEGNVSGCFADQTLCCSESDLNFNDEKGFAGCASPCFDIDLTFFGKEQGKIKLSPSCVEEELEVETCSEAFSESSSTPSSSTSLSRCFGSEDLDVNLDDASTTICLHAAAGSSRSSLMSLVSVLDSTIRLLVDPIAVPLAVYNHEGEDEDEGEGEYGTADEDLEKMFEVDLGIVDMELEPGFSYSSRIISVNYPLLREVSVF